MKYFFAFLFLYLAIVGCKGDTTKNTAATAKPENIVRYASGLSIQKFEGYWMVTVANPWPNATKDFRYIIRNEGANIPKNLQNLSAIDVPVKKIIVTSTTHIPSLEMLGEENSLIGFPNLGYISSKKTRTNIALGKIRELGSNQSLNTEVIIDLQPDVIIGYGIDNHNPTIDNLERSGLNVLLNGDWNESEPLGKAEWIKLFGLLYGKEKQADSIFEAIVTDYKKALEIAKKAKHTPKVLMGGMFQNKWNVPSGDSWGTRFIADGNGNYPWAHTKGTGSKPLPFEAVLEKAGDADVWIGPGQFRTMAEMLESNPHYARFKAFKNKNVFTFKVGDTGGILYYELAPNRPDLVIMDVIKMLHPELLPNHQLFFFEKMK